MYSLITSLQNFSNPIGLISTLPVKGKRADVLISSISFNKEIAYDTVDFFRGLLIFLLSSMNVSMLRNRATIFLTMPDRLIDYLLLLPSEKL